MGLLHPSPIVCGLGRGQNIRHKRMTPGQLATYLWSTLHCVFFWEGWGWKGNARLPPISAAYPQPIGLWPVGSGERGGGERGTRGSRDKVEEGWERGGRGVVEGW